MKLLKIRHVNENSSGTVHRVPRANLSKISYLKNKLDGGKGSESNNENEGITQDVDENKSPVFHSSGVTQDVHENKRLIRPNPRCYRKVRQLEDSEF